MSTMEQARLADVTPDAADLGATDLGAAAEEQMAKIVTELGAALGVLLTSLGTRSGLWAALAGAGPLTTAAVAAVICDGPGGALVDAAATMLSSMGEGFPAFSEAFSSGRGFGWHQRTA